MRGAIPSNLKMINMNKLKSFQELNYSTYVAEIKRWIKHAEKQMKIWEDKDREQYNFWAGYRMAFVDFFNIE